VKEARKIMDKANIEDIYKLTPTQQGMLFHTLEDAGSEAYFQQITASIHERLDTAAFRRAWERAVERHPVLRTAFFWKEAQRPLQVVNRQASLPWEEHDWWELPPDEQESCWSALLREDRERGFDLARPPLMRLTVVRVADDRYRLVWSHHHLLLDGWSLPLLLQEVLAFYGALSSGTDLHLARPRAYRDYVAWLDSRDPAEAEAFWRRELAGFGAATPLGLEPRGAGLREDRELRAALDEEITTALNGLARRLGLTLNTLVQGAWALALAHQSGEEDVVFGFTASGRPADLAGVESMIGLFINTVPVRVRIDRERSVADWLRGLQERGVELRRFEFTPLSQVQAWSEVPAGEPLLETLLVFENYPVGEALEARREALDVRDVGTFERSNYPVTVSAVPGTVLGLKLVHDGSRLSAPAAGRLLERLRLLLEGMAAAPDARVGDLPAITEAERRQLLAWSAAPGPRVETTVPALFLEQAARTPDAIALEHEDLAWTFRELADRAEQVALRLRSLGVRSGEPVGLAVERSLELAAGLLGILRAGGVFLPLDPAYPDARLELMLADALEGRKEPVVLAGHGLEERFARLAPAGTRLARLEEGRVEGTLTDGPDLSDPAYLIYTSGSTGRPKAVVVEHRQLAHTLAAAREAFGFEAGDRMPCLASFSFDIFLLELLGSMLAGGTASLVSLKPALDLERLLDLVERSTRLHAVPALMRQIVDAIRENRGGGRFGSLRTVFVGGDAVPADLLADLRRTFPGAEARVLYGPTEATIICSSWKVYGDRPSLGWPLPGVRLHVCDREGYLVPLGAPGEILIGGEGVARGYLGRPDLTAERFVPDPFADRPSARLYRSGDLARRLPDGRLEFLGRVDAQVKIRGFRVEPGEIEAALTRLPGVRQAVVMVRGEAAGRRLVAYVVGGQDTDLRAALAAFLPEAMIPSAFVFLEALPLTAHGKVDRRALPAPETLPQAATAREFVAPATREETLLAEVWAQVLGVPKVGVHDNFFELGGDSILSLQIVSRATKAGLKITPGQIFRHPTIAELAGLASGNAPTAAAARVRLGTVPLSPIQSLFFERELPDPHHFNHALLLATRERLDPARLERAFAVLLGQHDAMHLRFDRGAEGWSQRQIAPEGPVPFVRVDLSALPETARAAAVTGVSTLLQASLDLSRGPLVRVASFDHGAGEGGRLLIVIHHLAVDGVSWRILLEDLEEVYGQLGRGETPSLPARTTSFAEWADRQAEKARSGALDGELAYWADPVREQVRRLPVDFPDGDNAFASAETVAVALEVEETQALLREVPAAYRTRIDDALLGAVLQAFSAWTGEPRLLVDLETHGRDEEEGIDLSRTVGWFTAVYPVLLELRGGESPGEAIRTVKEQLRAVPGGGTGYGALRYLASPETAERLRALPAAEVAFNNLGQLDQALPADSPFALAPEDPGPAVSPRAGRSHLLTIDARISGGRLWLSWTYSGRLHRRETVERLADGALAFLRSLTARGRVPGEAVYSPSDFPLAGIGQTELDRLVVSAGGPIEDLYPLSPVQQGMLYHTLSASEAGTYYEQVSWTIRGELEPAAMQRAWAWVTARHPILRTAFAWEGVPQPLQVVRAGVEPVWRELDWGGFSGKEQDGRLQGLLREERRHGFDLSAAPLASMTLIRRADDHWVIVHAHHHALLDGWSVPLILSELFFAYREIAAGREPSRPLPHPYREYIDWLQRQDLAEAEAFWRETLRGVTEPTPLGIDRSYAADPDDLARRRSLVLPETVTAELRGHARRLQLTLNTLVQGAWALLLHRYSGQDKVVYGSVVSGRPPELPGIETMVGLFINTLPVAVRVSAADRLTAWLAAFQEQQVEARRFEHTPLTEVQGWSEVPRNQPLFHTFLAFENYPLGETLKESVRGLVVDDVASFQRTNYPIAGVVIPGERLGVRLTYDPRLFDALSMDRLLGHLGNLLRGLAADPDRHVGDLSLLTPAERQQLAVEWQGRRLAPWEEGQEDRCVHEMFEEQEALDPEAPALVYEDSALTHGEINRRANHLAHRLRRLGVGPEVQVGICSDRSLAFVVGLLAVLKAGGAYVPLDAAYPAERLRGMLEDAGCRLMLLRSGLSVDLAGIAESGVRILDLDEDPEPQAVEDESNPVSGVTPENAVYTIFTSGSTGRPKGVTVEHRHLHNHLRGVLRRLRLAPRSHVAVVSTVAADLGNTPLFGALCSGHCLHVISEARAKSPDQFADYLGRHPIDFLKIVPSHLNALRSSPRVAALLPTRCLMAGGETFFWRDAREMQARDPESSILNHYGPTESAVGVLSYRLPSAGPAGMEMAVAPGTPWLPLGRPMVGTQVYLLDPCGQPAPVGVPGELHIGGASVSRGYIGRPAATAEKFVPDPFGGEPGARLYRTGDLARARPDGNLEFLGRVDHQIKVRGFRVELEEIEGALRRHPALRAAVVVARERAAGIAGNDRDLVAYVVAANESTPSATDIRAFLGESLPAYMVPTFVVLLDAIPLNANGKVDRRALPDPQKEETAGEMLAPRTDTEKALAALWSEALGLESVAADANFFDMGGHSIAAIRILGRFRDLFGLDVSPRRFFEIRTLADLALHIDDLRRGAGTETAAEPTSTLDLDAEVALDPIITGVGRTAEWSREPRSVLLTGATGFVGSFLLAELLRRTRADVFCLVRAAGPVEGLDRIRRSLEAYSLWDDSLAARIRPLPGDLAQPRLGLSPERFHELSAELDAIYHNGALVNFAYPYAALKRPNVLGTGEVLRLAAEGRVKPVHFVSTTSVFDSDLFADWAVVDESVDPSGSRGLPDGYVQSKWVGERLVRLAGERGLPVAIYRMGRVGWDSRTGAWAETDFVYRMIRSCLQLGSAPELDRLIPITPVDYVAAALVELSLKPGSRGGAFHLTAPKPVEWNRIVGWMTARGYRLRRIPFGAWQEELMASLRGGSTDNALYPLAVLAAGGGPREEADAQIHELEKRIAHVDSQGTLRALAGAVPYPELDDASVSAFFDRSVRVGLVEPPGVPAGVLQSVEVER
jgi:amino acid adenylation domain-containing protein/thioester reductase-like protein/non-ribosomal peptide synthase protein (TIGR01720 family)